MQPRPTARPEDWPGGAGADGFGLPAPGANFVYDPRRSQSLTSARVLATVNSEVILYSEVAGFVNDVLSSNADKIPPEQLDKQRDFLTAMRMRQLIETKLLYADAKKTIQGRNADGWTKLVDAVGADFEKQELKRLLRRGKVKTRTELEASFKAMGTSVEREKRAYIERAIASQWLHQQTEVKESDLPPQELWTHYADHRGDYFHPAEVRWEHLMTKKERYDESASRERLCKLGNQVIDGASFAEVVKLNSEGPDKSVGGQHDWTKLDDLEVGATHVSDEMRAALETLPIGALSQVIEDSQGYHIVRVVERRASGYTPFEEVQSDLRTKLENEMLSKKMDEFLAKLKKGATIRTIYDNTEIMAAVIQQEETQKKR